MVQGARTQHQDPTFLGDDGSCTAIFSREKEEGFIPGCQDGKEARGSFCLRCDEDEVVISREDVRRAIWRGSAPAGSDAGT